MFFPFFPCFNSCFSLFSLFICDIACLFKSRFSLFYVLKHIRLLDLFLLYLCSYFSGLGFRVSMRTHAFYMRTHTRTCNWVVFCRPYVCTRILVPRNSNSTFLLLFLYSVYIICFCFVLFYAYKSLFVCSSHARLRFLFNSFFVLPWTYIQYERALIHRCCDAVK